MAGVFVCLYCHSEEIIACFFISYVAVRSSHSIVLIGSLICHIDTNIGFESYALKISSSGINQFHAYYRVFLVLLLRLIFHGAHSHSKKETKFMMPFSLFMFAILLYVVTVFPRCDACLINIGYDEFLSYQPEMKKVPQRESPLVWCLQRHVKSSLLFLIVYSWVWCIVNVITSSVHTLPKDSRIWR